MKRFTVIFIVLVAAFLISGCSNKPDYILTLATPFSEAQINEMGLQKQVSGYSFENIQAYKREDAKEAIYLYSAPIEQSSNLIVKDEDGYVAEGTYFRKYFPCVLSNESLIVISNDTNYGKIYMQDRELKGKLENRDNIFGLNKQAVVYENAFGKGKDYICYPTSFGVNTEIVLPEKPEEFKFQIRIKLPNLVLDTGSPDYILFKTALENGDVKSIIYTPLIADAKGNWSYDNSVKLIDKDVEKNTYTVEYTADESFLNDENTEYPVTLNQSIYLYKSKQPDTSAYENTGDEAGHYLSPYILLGDSTLKGEGWTYVRYETLNDIDIDPERIVSAKYIFHNLFDLEKEVKIAAYAVDADWCSINTRWFNRPPFDEKPISEVMVKAAGDYEFDITTLLIEMIKNKGEEDTIHTVQNSFMIRCDTKDSNIIISSGDNGLFSPVLEIVISK